MGQRHNRRRTRSRPRHRSNNSSSSNNLSNHSRDSSSADIHRRSGTSVLPVQASAAHWHEQYSAWQMRTLQQRHEEDEEREAQRLRLFGGERGDEESLCEPMLRVVMDLFNDIDYEDP